MDRNGNSKESLHRPAELAGLESRLKELDLERAELTGRIARLRTSQNVQAASGVGEPGMVTRNSPPGDKIALFAGLFRGRTDIYAVRWENVRAGRR